VKRPRQNSDWAHDAFHYLGHKFPAEPEQNWLGTSIQCGNPLNSPATKTTRLRCNYRQPKRYDGVVS